MLMNNLWGWTGRKVGAASWFGPHSSFSLTFSTAFRFGMVSTALQAVCCCSAAVLGLLLAQLIWTGDAPGPVRNPVWRAQVLAGLCHHHGEVCCPRTLLFVSTHSQSGYGIPPSKPAVIHSRTFQRSGVLSQKFFWFSLQMK